MSRINEIKNRISAVKELQKITNATYLISSVKVKKAQEDLLKTKPYFTQITDEIKRIFKTVENVESKYFYSSEETVRNGTYGYLVITADKGLAGAYNHNVIKNVENAFEKHGLNKLFVVGDFGRSYFISHKFSVDESFVYNAQRPTLGRARKIAYELIDRFLSGEISKLFVTYTDFTNNKLTVKTERILPLHSGNFIDAKAKGLLSFEFDPSPEKVLENIVPSCVTGYVYSALVDSFCSEQNARMVATYSACDNAQNVLDGLKREYNRIRQGEITRQITEVSAGAKSVSVKEKTE